MNIKPMFRYCWRDQLRGAVTFLGIAVAVVALTLAANTIWPTKGYVSFSGAYEFAAMVTMFVVGICTVREVLRLSAQNGVSRRSMFAALALATALAAALLAVAGELLVTLGAALSRDMENLSCCTLYQIFYNNPGDVWPPVAGMTPAMHLESVLLSFSLVLLANMGGCFLSVLFYRLNKLWTIVVAISLPLLANASLIFGFSVSQGEDVRVRAVTYIASTPALLILAILLLALAVAALDWLLLRRAPIKAASR